MSIKKEIISRLVDNRIPFVDVKVDKNANLNGEDAIEVRVDDIKDGTGYSREWKFAKRNNMDEQHIADVVLSYFTVGRNGG